MTTQPASFDFTFGIQVGQLVVSGYENKRWVYRVIAVERRYYTSQDRCLPRGAQVGDEYNALVRLEKVLKPDMTPIKKPGNPVTFDACYIIPFTNAYIDEQIAALQARGRAPVSGGTRHSRERPASQIIAPVSKTRRQPMMEREGSCRA